MYAARYTATFKNRLKERHHAQQAKRIRAKCEMIVAHPYTACKSEPLKHSYVGKRSARVDGRYRIIYAICEECYNQGQQEANLSDCADCDDVPLKTVTFLDITDHYRR